jgi:F420H(2)-dependent quinone reductase
VSQPKTHTRWGTSPAALVVGTTLAVAAGGYLLRRGAHGRRSSRLLGRWFGNPVMVIETRGRRSGKRRATAIAYVPHPEGWVVMPINAGSDRTPSWWLNLAAGGSAEVVVDGRRQAVRPRVTAGEERERLWRAYVRQAPAMLEYARVTQRVVPVVVLEPA